MSAGLSLPVTWLRERLAARPDSEHEQAIVRLLVGTVLFFYLLPHAYEVGGGVLSPESALVLVRW